MKEAEGSAGTSKAAGWCVIGGLDYWFLGNPRTQFRGLKWGEMVNEGTRENVVGSSGGGIFAPKNTLVGTYVFAVAEPWCS